MGLGETIVDLLSKKWDQESMFFCFGYTFFYFYNFPVKSDFNII